MRNKSDLKINNDIPEWILEKLCTYDSRNPNNCLSVVDEEDVISQTICYCDNCFYGRTKLAEEIIKRHESRII